MTVDHAELERLAADGGLVLLYHAAFEAPPAAMAAGLHNVRPAVLEAQLRCLSRHFEFVDVDSFAAMSDPRGHAAVTFDDGYRSVFECALPVFESLDIPFTVYLNGTNFEGGGFWRDKVRFIGNMRWISEFESFMRGIAVPPGQRFYRYTKLPEVDSRMVDAELDRFLEFKGATDRLPRLCVSDTGELPRHQLVSYGNHGHHHYVLSSLNPDDQVAEIERTRHLLDTLEGRRISRLFSIPFGEARDVDRTACEALRAAGYHTMLMSRNRVQRYAFEMHGIQVVERFMPRDHVNAFHQLAGSHAESVGSRE